MKQILATFASLLLLSSLDTHAAGFGLELSPIVGARFGGSFETRAGDDLDLDAGLSYGLALDFGPRESELKYELLWSRQESGIDFRGLAGLDDLDVTVDQFMFGGVYETTQGRFRENISALVGGSVITAEGSDPQAFFSVGIGLGGKYYATKNLVFRVDIRGYCNIVESEGAFISTGGTTIVFFSGDVLWQGEVSVGVAFSF